jgi:putative hemolysin
MAATRFGFYSATLFEIGAIPAAVLGEAVETGRSCVDPQHRSGTVLRLPPLFEGYLSLGARVCGAPAFDHEFGSTDYLVLLDTLAMDPRVHRSLFK